MYLTLNIVLIMVHVHQIMLSFDCQLTICLFFLSLKSKTHCKVETKLLNHKISRLSMLCLLRKKY